MALKQEVKTNAHPSFRGSMQKTQFKEQDHPCTCIAVFIQSAPMHYSLTLLPDSRSVPS